jgi:hypothetical protein
MVKTHAVDSELRHARSDLLRVSVRGKICSESQIHTEEAQPLSIGKKVSVFDGNKPVSSCGFIQPRAKIRRGIRGIVPWKHARKTIHGLKR